ncbi:hypothetical protein SAMN02745781_01083 [Vibrio gazogenes DSM 21264]|uniref:Uncharacterized protein n=1 Tax=Vibrio gazogenes DSM 21264 = NBRC 103151 TaxID=1123492 RepID=A0A1M4XL42_VIBGA|nr:hypothetical protein SAMN02745781_01083 [Vibrio gazogenes DSM 21264] [Vibrio gazogenes DSM 21264 = NBRC 103151]
MFIAFFAKDALKPDDTGRFSFFCNGSSTAVDRDINILLIPFSLFYDESLFLLDMREHT